MATVYWSPNQAAIAQVETYTFTAPSSVGNTYTATINGKSVTYSSISGDTDALVATGLYNLLTNSIIPELTEITFANPSAGVITATANEPGTPFANVTVNGVSNQGLVLSTGNGLANGIATSHTTPNYSPSDVYDSLNWMRVIAPAPGVRALPQNGDDVIVANSDIPLLWNLDRLSAVQFNTYQRWQSFTGTIGLPERNANDYDEWRARYFKFSGPTGSVPAGGLQMTLGIITSENEGSGPGREKYDLGSSPCTMNILKTGAAIDDYAVSFLGVHTSNNFSVLGGASLAVAMNPGETSNLSSSDVAEGCSLGIGQGVTWSSGATLTITGGSAILNSPPTGLALNNAAQVTLNRDSLTWPSISAQGGSSIKCLAGGIITALTLTTSATLDKSQDKRALTITSSTIDGDSCSINDPLNTITFTNATAVRQQVSNGPFRFTGTRSVRVT